MLRYLLDDTTLFSRSRGFAAHRFGLRVVRFTLLALALAAGTTSAELDAEPVAANSANNASNTADATEATEAMDANSAKAEAVAEEAPAAGAGFPIDPSAAGVSYRPGLGFRFGESGLNIGGFGTFEFDRARGEALETAFDSLSFLVLFEPIPSFRIFAEIEIGDIFIHQARGASEFDPILETERLYGEVSLSDQANFRFGKFQTPVGRWNLVPAEPFVWTASDPVQLDTAFDEHQTGISAQGTFFPSAGEIDYWLYSQIIDPLDPSDSPNPASRSIGGRLQWTQPRGVVSLGGSFLATRRKGAWSGLAGLDAEIRIGDFELLTEAVFQDGGIQDRRLAGVFVQGRYALPYDFHLVSRYEFFDRLASPGDDVHLGDFGIAWQPQNWFILKATYRISTRETDDVERGFSSSISVVF